jgi:hypothetical protein
VLGVSHGKYGADTGRPWRVLKWTVDGHVPADPIANRASNVLHAPLAMRHFHEPAGSNESNDPATWDRASYTPDLLAELGEPLPEAPNDYREAAIYHLQLMYAVDEFLMAAKDARFAAIVVAVVLGWPSTRGLTVPAIAEQIGCTPATIARACARFREMSELVAGVRFIRPGAGSSNGDKAAVQA